MGNLSKIILGGTEYTIKDSTARQDISALETAQRVLESDQSDIGTLDSEYVVTTDPTFLRYKTYYSKDGSNYTQLVLGTDYDFGDEIEAGTVYQEKGLSMADIKSKINAVVGIVNAIIPAHRVIETEQASLNP